MMLLRKSNFHFVKQNKIDGFYSLKCTFSPKFGHNFILQGSVSYLKALFNWFLLICLLYIFNQEGSLILVSKKVSSLKVVQCVF